MLAPRVPNQAYIMGLNHAHVPMQNTQNPLHQGPTTQQLLLIRQAAPNQASGTSSNDDDQTALVGLGTREFSLVTGTGTLN